MRLYKPLIILILVSMLLVNPVLSSEERYNRIRPAIGGIQIHVPGSGGGTLGFAAIDEEGTLGYVTSFHVVENTQNQIYQPHSLGGDTCKLGKATVLGDPNVSHSAWVPCDGDFSVCPRVYKNNYTAGYEVVSYGDSELYDTVHLSGITSGLQEGIVLNDDRLVTLFIDNKRYDMEHQCEAYMTSGLGDSGAPVFKITDGDSIEIVGLMHSGNASLGRTYYSHISQVINDLDVVPCTVDTYGNTPLPGYTFPPKDLDGDGLYEDVTGNGDLSYVDVVEFYQQMDWIETHMPIERFDYNGNGRLDYDDLVILSRMADE